MQGGLNQLKVSKGNDTIDEFLLEVYHNLSVYALISNSGQGTKGSMFPMFDVINDDFAEYINTLTFEDIKKMLPKSKDVVKLLLGKPNTLESIMRKKTFVSNTEFIHGSSYSEEDTGVPTGGEVDIEADSMAIDYMLQDNEVFENMGRAYTNNKRKMSALAITQPIKTTKGSMRNAVFSSEDQDLVNSNFLGAETIGPDKIAIQLFPITSREAGAVSSSLRHVTIKGYSTTKIAELALLGLQPGMPITVDGQNVKLLAFLGLEYTKKIVDGKSVVDKAYRKYMIADEEGNIRWTTGKYIMEQNPDLYIHGNIIKRNTSSTETFKQALLKRSNADIEGLSEETIGHNEIVVDSYVKSLFGEGKESEDVIKNDPYLAQEVSLINSSFSNVMMRVPGIYTDEILKTFLEAKGIKSSNINTDNVFIPSIRAEKQQDKALQKYQNNVSDLIAEELNSLVPGEAKVYYSAAFTGDSVYKKVITGEDIIEKMFTYRYKEGFVKEVRYEPGANGAYRVKITRKPGPKRTTLIPVNNVIMAIQTVETEKGVYEVDNKFKKQSEEAIALGIFDKKIAVPHIKVNIPSTAANMEFFEQDIHNLLIIPGKQRSKIYAVNKHDGRETDVRKITLGSKEMKVLNLNSKIKLNDFITKDTDVIIEDNTKC